MLSNNVELVGNDRTLNKELGEGPTGLPIFKDGKSSITRQV